jgi:hypothetical protein
MDLSRDIQSSIEEKNDVDLLFVTIFDSIFDEHLSGNNFIHLLQKNKYYNQRGAFLIVYEDVKKALLTIPRAHYIPAYVLDDVIGGSIMSEVRTYDMNNSYLLIVSVCFDKKARKKNEEDALVRCLKLPFSHEDIKKSLKLNLQGVNAAISPPEIKQCMHCGKKPIDLKCCGMCRSYYYCDPGCQKKDWKSHRLICTNLTRAKESGRSILNTYNRETLGIRPPGGT